jgi:protein TonB
MASPARIVKTVPDTLPADFGEWDEKSGHSAPAGLAAAAPAAEPRIAAVPASAPASQSGAADMDFPHSRPPQHGGMAYANEKSFLDQLISMNGPGIAPPETNEPVEARHNAPAPKPHNARASSQAAVPIRRFTHDRVDAERSRPAPKAAANARANAIVLEPMRIKAVDVAESKPAFSLPALAPTQQKSKLIIAAAAGAVAVLLLIVLLAFALSHTSRPVHSNSPAVPQPAATAAPAQQDALKPSPATPVANAPAQAADNAQPAADAAPAADTQDPPAPQVQAQMMNDQLSAPSRISAEMKNKAPEDAPPTQAIDAAGLGGSANPGSVLGGQAAPRVQAAPPRTVNVSAGVAVGLLVQKTAPVYPMIARTAHVSGTVVLEATISKAGAIENLRVVTGPEMLRQSALDAVRTWRFKPYKLNNQPTEIETTINVVFALNQ